MADNTIGVLKQLLEQAKQGNLRLESVEKGVDQTNARLDQTNARLDSLEGRVELLETRVSRGFDEMSSNLGQYVERLDVLTRRQTDSELRLATEVLSLADVTREVRDLLSQKLDDHHAVEEHEADSCARGDGHRSEWRPTSGRQCRSCQQQSALDRAD